MRGFIGLIGLIGLRVYGVCWLRHRASIGSLIGCL